MIDDNKTPTCKVCKKPSIPVVNLLGEIECSWCIVKEIREQRKRRQEQEDNDQKNESSFR
jgi:hypothetical protein